MIIQIPPERLNSTTLQTLIEEYVLRNSEEYEATPLTERREVVEGLLRTGEVLIVYDCFEESCTIIRCEEQPFDLITEAEAG